MLQNYTWLDSPDSGARSSRLAIGRVFRRLALDRVSAEFVDNCALTLDTEPQLLAAKYALEKITTAAIGKKNDEMEADDDEIGVSWGKVTAKKKVDEKKMYKPLMTLFKHVEHFPDSLNTQPKHSFQSTDSVELKSDSSTWGFPKVSPDFTMIDLSSSAPTFSGRKRSVLWRQRSAFCEVKPTPQQGPRSEDPNVVKTIVSQAADYARLHLSARPFQLFSVGLLIFGSQFCVAIFDRGGVLFSPIHDMWAEVKIFIRVIRSLTCHLSSIELGQDPTVTTLSGEQEQSWRKQARELGHVLPDDFPTFMITNGGVDNSCWYTIGLPIWTSVSLLGRGTAVWLVRDKSTGAAFVLKNTWRNAARISESIIYGSIDGHHPAVAKLHHGGDVLFPGEQRLITVGNLRGPDTKEGLVEGDVVLHRLLLATLGRPLWEYRSEKELLQGMPAALSAHQFLCNQGILHRDISAGNIMLAAKTRPEEGAEGFLMDLEFAHIKRSSLDITTKIPVPPVRTPGGGMASPTERTHTIFGEDVMRGAAMTGTAQFMAEEILRATLRRKPIQHEAHHDIESFIYVLCYSVSRRLVLESGSLEEVIRKDLHACFHTAFGRMKLSDIYTSRPKATFLLREFFENLLSVPLTELMRALETLLQLSKYQPDRAPITHSLVLSELDAAIAKME